MTDAPRRRLAWAIRTSSHDICDPADIRFAPTRAKARAAIISDMRDAWSCDWIDAARAITSIRRAPEQDVTLPHRHALARLIRQDLLHIVVHAFGGTGLKAGYRDHYFTTSNDADLLALVDAGLFRRGREYPSECTDGTPMAYFHLTELGRLVAAGEQPEYPDA